MDTSDTSDTLDASASLIQNYTRLPVAFTHGEGAWLWDDKGRRCLDAVAGIAVCSLGHAHPAVTAALCEQARRVTHTSNLYRIAAQEKLAGELARISGLETAFFCNSGAEANEAAIKIARLAARANGNDHPVIAVARGAFHGRTLGAWSATDPLGEHPGTPPPLAPGFVQTPFGDIAALEKIADETPQLCAVMLEPIQGENGVRIPADGTLRAVRELCDRRGLLLILDEVQTGLCRTGAWYCFQHEGAAPDLLTTAKALGNGVPVGACLGRRETTRHLAAGAHGSTFGGNPLACAAALAVVETMEKEKLHEQAARTGDHLLAELRRALAGVSSVSDIRGRGLLIGVELNRPCQALVQAALEHELLINVTAERVIRLAPPLILERAQAGLLVERLAAVIADFGDGA